MRVAQGRLHKTATRVSMLSWPLRSTAPCGASSSSGESWACGLTYCSNGNMTMITSVCRLWCWIVCIASIMSALEPRLCHHSTEKHEDRKKHNARDKLVPLRKDDVVVVVLTQHARGRGLFFNLGHSCCSIFSHYWLVGEDILLSTIANKTTILCPTKCVHNASLRASWPTLSSPVTIACFLAKNAPSDGCVSTSFVGRGVDFACIVTSECR